MTTQQKPNEVKFVYLIELLQELKQTNQEAYKIEISFRNKRFYRFTITAYLDSKGNRLFYFSDLLGGILSYQHKDLLIKKLNVPGYDGYINVRLNQEELNKSIDYVFQRSKNLIYEGQTYSKGRIAYDMVESLYNYINDHADMSSNQELLVLENQSIEDDLDETTPDGLTSNYNDEGVSIDAFVKLKNPEFYGEFIISIQKNPDGTVEPDNILLFRYLTTKITDIVNHLLKSKPNNESD